MIGVPDPLLGEAVKAFVAPTMVPGWTRLPCTNRLESHMVLQRVELVTALPRTNSGKIRKIELA